MTHPLAGPKCAQPPKTLKRAKDIQVILGVWRMDCWWAHVGTVTERSSGEDSVLNYGITNAQSIRSTNLLGAYVASYLRLARHLHSKDCTLWFSFVTVSPTPLVMAKLILTFPPTRNCGIWPPHWTATIGNLRATEPAQIASSETLGVIIVQIRTGSTAGASSTARPLFAAC
jgi:hypothetical protein